MGALYNRAILTGGQLVSVPILLAAWGANVYGGWITATALASFLNYSNVGLPGAMRSEMAVALGDNQRSRAADVFKTSLIFVIPVTATVAAAAVIILVTLPPPRDGGPWKSVEVAFLLQVALLVVGSVLNAGLSALGSYGLGNALDATRQASEWAWLLPAAVLFHFPIAFIAWIYPLISLFYTVTLAIVLATRAPWLWLGPWRFDLFMFRRLLPGMTGIVAMTFGYYGMAIQAPRVILAITNGPSAVVTFTICYMLLRTIRIPIDIVGHSATVEVAAASGRRDFEGARRLISNTLGASFWVSLILLPVVVIFSGQVVEIWTRGAIHPQFGVILGLSVATLCFSLGLPCQEALMAIGQLGKVSVPVAIGAPILLGIGFVASKAVGVTGMAFAVAAIEAAYGFLALFWAARLFGFDLASILRVLLRPPHLFLKDEILRLMALKPR